jgi:excisionase family DNA binding protein
MEYIEILEQRIEALEKIVSLATKTVLNINELSKLTGISKSTIYKFTSNGSIPYYKQAKYLFFDRVEIENWLKENKGA